MTTQTAKEYVSIPIASLIVDESFNVRREPTLSDEEKKKVNAANRDDANAAKTIKGLAEDMRLRGQLVPVLVMPARKQGTFKLVDGFRRVAAAKLLKWTHVNAIVDTTWDEQDAYFVNWIANIARKDLGPYENAVRALEMRKKFQISGEQIGARIGLSKNYVNTLIQCAESLPKEILEDWRNRNGSCSMGNLQKWVVLATQEEMTNAWRAEKGIATTPVAPGTPQAPKAPKRMMRSQKLVLAALVHAQKAIASGSLKTDNQMAVAAGIVAALRWVLGEEEQVLGFFASKKKSKPSPGGQASPASPAIAAEPEDAVDGSETGATDVDAGGDGPDA